jgi:alkylated DNA nucleotide flippase Atl1
MKITEAELFDALERAAHGDGPEDARTMMEMARAAGVGERQTRRALHVLNAEGRLVVHRVIRTALDGRRAQVAAYTILPPPKKKR